MTPRPISGSSRRSREFAVKAHGDQKYGDNPYSYHLDKVVNNATKFGGNEKQIQAAYLHDVLEDTSVSKEELEQNFGKEITNIVDLLSNTGNKEETFKRIRTNPDAVFVKLCDRLANVSEGQKNNKYKKEHPLFKSILYKKGEFDELWNKIDSILEK
jgi:(p)ppGpp synthase/HD superfamily hydrolase